MYILIVDDHPLTCQGLAALLQATQRDARASSVYSAAQAREALPRLPAAMRSCRTPRWPMPWG